MVISFSITSSALGFLASSGEPSSTLASFQIRYYSMYGHVEKLAEEIRKGAASIEGVEAKLWQVPETFSEEALSKMNAAPKRESPSITLNELTKLMFSSLDSQQALALKVVAKKPPRMFKKQNHFTPCKLVSSTALALNARKSKGVVIVIIEDDNPYDMEEMLMPLHKYLDTPTAHDIIDNGATLKKHTRFGIVYRSTKALRSLGNLHHFLPNVVGSQVLSQVFPSNATTKTETTKSEASVTISESASDKSKFQMTVKILMKVYEGCNTHLRKMQGTRRVNSLKRISPANFTRGDAYKSSQREHELVSKNLVSTSKRSIVDLQNELRSVFGGMDDEKMWNLPDAVMSVTSNGCASIEAPWRKELSIRTEGSDKERRLKPDITKLQRARDRSIRRKPTKVNSSEAHRRLNDGARIETEEKPDLVQRSWI
ncbi:unnamed protein product [Microthlaspi erraticum]|uniref:Flavodoxin-like domain-containing protein n=1 Tax=Microthlaspi erraticum TaxID=1685480 RepID=A0A6D2IXQ6_9BRAS|nr:unnamed protein product [Microthlaspi erraticum]